MTTSPLANDNGRTEGLKNAFTVQHQTRDNLIVPTHNIILEVQKIIKKMFQNVTV
jgi:hypothetical protein